MSWYRPTIMLAMCLLLAAAGLNVAAGQPVNPVADEANQVLATLHSDIDLLGTINRLELQPAEISPLLGLIDELAGEQRKIEPQREAVIAALVPLLQEKRALLLVDRPVSDNLENQIKTSQDKLQAMSQALDEARIRHAGEARKILTAPQVDIITGADQARDQAEELLDWIHGLSAGDFAEEGQGNAGELADPSVHLTAADIMKVFQQARKMSGAEYARNKPALIRKLMPLYMPIPEAADDSLVQFLSSPRLGALLKERSEKLGLK